MSHVNFWACQGWIFPVLTHPKSTCVTDAHSRNEQLSGSLYLHVILVI